MTKAEFPAPSTSNSGQITESCDLPSLALKMVLATKIMARLPRELRDMIYAQIWDDWANPILKSKCKWDSPLGIDDFHRHPPFFVNPAVVHRDFALEAAEYLYENYQHIIDTDWPKTPSVRAYFTTDHFGVGLSPSDVAVKDVQITLLVNPERYDSIHLDLAFLLDLRIVDRGLHLSIDLDHFAPFETVDVHGVVQALKPVVERFGEGNEVELTWSWCGHEYDIADRLDDSMEAWHETMMSMALDAEKDWAHQLLLKSLGALHPWASDDDIYADDQDYVDTDEDHVYLL